MSLKTKSINEILKLFQDYLKTDEAQNHLDAMQKEKVDIKLIMDKLPTIAKDDPEFINLVLYGLIPHSKTKVARRVSHFPAVYDIKSYLKWLNYSKDDWKKIAHLIYNFASNFQANPENLRQYVEEYAQSPYSKGMQCGTISPIIFAINDKYPLVNNPVKRTYSAITQILGHPDKLGDFMKDYPQSVIKLEKFVEEIDSPLLQKQDCLDLFCYWFDNNTYYLERAQKRKSQKNLNDYSEEDEAKIEVFNLSDFIKTVDLKDPRNFSPHKLRNPEREKITEIISYCKKTNWVLPHFQRYFDWKKDDIIDFLRAIFNDYYVGAFLLWEAGRDPEVKVQPIKGIEKEEIVADSVILDGQQRITSLLYAINGPKNSIFYDKSKWRDTKIFRDHPIYFYIDFKEFFKDPDSLYIVKTRKNKLEENDCFENLLFPFYELENYDDWTSRFEWHLRQFSDNEKKVFEIKELIRKKLSHIWSGFEIPYISLPKKMRINQVTEIFEQLNTKGKPLNVFDLLIARLYKYEIQLKDLWDETKKQHNETIFRYFKTIDKIPIYILQSISLVYDKNSSAKRSDILDIYSNIYEKNENYVFEEHWIEMANYMDIALHKLENFRKDGFGVRSEKEAPFAPIIPVLTALLRLIDHQENKKSCFEKLQKWYWSSVFTNSYSSAADSQMTLDYKQMKNWFKDDNQIPKTVKEMMTYDIFKINLREVKSKSSAKFKGIMSLLALEGAIDFDTNQTLENARENDQDHIFPKSMVQKVDQPRLINSVLNMTWMSKETNRTIKKFKMPSDYIPDFVSHNYQGNKGQFIDVLKTHMINEKAYNHMLKNKFNDFLTERNNIMLSKIAKRIGLEDFDQKSKLISPNTPFTNKKIVWDTLRKCNGYLYWVDKYFSKAGLERIVEAELDPKNIKEIRILMSSEKVNDKFRKIFKNFKNELEKQGIICEARMITENEIKNNIHDRWILAENCGFNVASPDVIARGQFSEIRETDNRPPFEEWWKKSKDILAQ